MAVEGEFVGPEIYTKPFDKLRRNRATTCGKVSSQDGARQMMRTVRRYLNCRRHRGKGKEDVAEGIWVWVGAKGRGQRGHGDKGETGNGVAGSIKRKRQAQVKGAASS